jgi:hypothetical protein
MSSCSNLARIVCIAAVIAPAGLAGQDQTSRAIAPADTFGVVVGTVKSRGTEQPVPFARVSLGDTHNEVLAAADGSFRLQGVRGGTHTVNARQIGFEPLAAHVVVDGAGGATPSTIVLTMSRLPMMLDTVKVIAGGACTTKGFASAANAPMVQQLFQQVALNAEQYLALLAKYPVSVSFARRVWLVSASGAISGERTDTLTQRQGTRPYAPGAVAELRTDAQGKPDFHVIVPAFGSLGSPVFQDHHCFRYAGTDSILGHRLYRIDFVPTIDITTTDVAGSIYLDKESLMLRYARFRITNLPTAGLGFTDFEATTSYREIAPYFVVNGGLDGSRQLQNMKTADGEQITEGRQSDRFISSKFLGAKP